MFSPPTAIYTPGPRLSQNKNQMLQFEGRNIISLI